MRDSEHYKVIKKGCLLEGELNYHLVLFGDELAKREKYKTYDGMEAIYFYLINKYHWLPSVVKSLDKEEIRFILQDEMHSWTIPNKAKVDVTNYKLG